MGRGDNSPVPHTCPDINKAQSNIDDAVSSMKEAIDFFNKLSSELENVRDENVRLREWGNEQYNRAESAENELWDANRKIESLEDEIKSLERELKSAQS